ncbi:MAG: phospholipase, partial [Chloroflexi bacterium]|nr:phospholipase [Chloroflexota bacterium]
MIGHEGDRANHQYDLDAFWTALQADALPSVSFVTAPSSHTGHPQTSDALSEQKFLVDTVNALQQSSEWSTLAIVIAYGDSDGWYDHAMPPILAQSNHPGLDSICGADDLPD